MTDEKQQRLRIGLTQEQFARIKATAEADGRSTAGWARWHLLKACDMHEMEQRQERLGPELERAIYNNVEQLYEKD